MLVALRLSKHTAVPLEAECLERPKYALRRTGHLAGPIHILNADQPPTALRTRVEIARHRGVQRAQVQLAGGGWCEPADVAPIRGLAAPSGIGRRGRRTAFRGVRAVPAPRPTGWPPGVPRAS
jgi:hypothetical protein